MSDHYILSGPEGKDAIPFETNTPEGGIDSTKLSEWARLCYDRDRRVAKTAVGELEVSTVFLGLDHSFGGGRPLIFETMIFGCDPKRPMNESYCDRYSTWAEAEEGHAKAVKVAEKQWDKIMQNREKKIIKHILKERS